MGIEPRGVRLLTRPGGEADAVRSIEVTPRAWLKTSAGEHRFGRFMRANLRKYRTAIRDPRMRCAGQMERMVERQKQVKHIGAAEDGNDAVGDAEAAQWRVQRCPGWIPQ
jgi:hypothetical protein